MLKNIAIGFLFFLCSCGSLVNGTRQNVMISSTPSQADVFVDQCYMGRTPLCAKLSRRDNHVVRVEIPGYAPYEALLNREYSGWTLGNIVFGGIPGIAIDAISGGMYKLSEAAVHANLSESIAHMQTPEGATLIVVEKPASDWEKVGQLESSAHLRT